MPQNEPWRYVCVECGRQDLRWRRTLGQYYCPGCKTKSEKMFDKKTGRRVDSRASSRTVP